MSVPSALQVSFVGLPMYLVPPLGLVRICGRTVSKQQLITWLSLT